MRLKKCVSCSWASLWCLFVLDNSIPVAPERIWKWGGTGPAQSAGKNFFTVPPHFSRVPP